jgi:MFS family permease
VATGGTEQQRRRVLVASLLGVFVSLFPVLIVVAALPEIADDLGSSEATLAWVLTTPLIVAAVILPTAGRLGDLHGHRRVFLLGLTVSGAFALAASLAWDPLSLVAFRTVSQAAGTAAGPSAIALVIAAHLPEDRARVLGFWAFSTAISPALGLLTGGPAVDALSWRGLFVLQAVATIGVVLYARRTLSETAKARSVRFDVPGAVAFMVVSGSIAFGFDRAGRWGWSHPVVLASFVAFALAVVTFLRVERRALEPVLPPALLRHGSFLASCGGELLVQVSTNGALFVAPLVFHETFGAGIGRIAWYMAPMPLGMSLVAPLGGRFVARIGERPSAVIGSVLLGATLLGMVADELWIVLLAWLGVGAANGLIRPAVASAAAAALDEGQVGAGIAATRMISTWGAAAGITLAIGLIPLGGHDLAFTACAVAGALGAVTARWIRVGTPPSAGTELAVEAGMAPGPA